jgi:hypothetical protein
MQLRRCGYAVGRRIAPPIGAGYDDAEPPDRAVPTMMAGYG